MLIGSGRLVQEVKEAQAVLLEATRAVQAAEQGRSAAASRVRDVEASVQRLRGQQQGGTPGLCGAVLRGASDAGCDVLGGWLQAAPPKCSRRATEGRR